MSEINSENCTHDCSTCSANCGDRTAPNSFLAAQNEYSDVKKVIGVVSGKGGVGKSLVTGLLSSAMRRLGKETAVLDADITGPSIPRLFGVKEKATGTETMLFPAETKEGIKLMSINLLLLNEDDPVVWRGPVIAGVIKQFWSEVAWGKVDYMFVDMPPGTGDSPLTVFQSLPVDGIVIVTSPQELVSMIVKKAVNMAEMMNIPVIGLVENMAYYDCPDCGKRHYIFGESHAAEIAERYNVPAVASLPIDPAFAALSDAGRIQEYETDALGPVIEKILSL
ncbi:MAG: Mrp/NBP35 family ATP-binding protein [Lachnospiraceae bacterium]|nr:Mrp/NBP35 family ATP-binding protein [Lachnospiraceae bacterium]